MTEQQQTIVRVIAIEQAIQAVIRDLRIPEKLRTALAVYQHLRDPSNRGIDILPGRQAERTCLPKAIRYSLADVCQPYNSPGSTNEDCGIPNCLPATIEQEIEIRMWHNDESLDWSVEINGQRHEHITSEIMEALVECALIVAQMSLTQVVAARPQ
jgi:hypothetical protein